MTTSQLNYLPSLVTDARSPFTFVKLGVGPVLLPKISRSRHNMGSVLCFASLFPYMRGLEWSGQWQVAKGH